MAEEDVKRRLAAILAADVVGYSRLIELDEAGTLAGLKERRKGILEPLVARHHGRIVKVMGDGVLIEFASAVNAVLCGVHLQQQMTTANSGIADERHIRLRVGINLGDVVVEGSDLYGDGVIIAVRLQALAEPGGICLSRGVHEQVRNKLPFAYEDLGPCVVKNIAKPIRALRLTGFGQHPAHAADPPSSSVAIAAAATSLVMPQTPPSHSLAELSIAVLPFSNMSGDPMQQYFSDGITEDIITELSRFHQLHVVARNSSFRYRDPTINMTRVGQELGAKYLLEGSVRRQGERVRITAQLINSESGHHLWAERFDRDQTGLFAVQDEVVQTIVGTLVGRVQAATVELVKRKAPASLEAYECVLRGDALQLGNQETEAEARRLYQKAIELDPGYARAYSFLAISYWLIWRRDMSGSDDALDRALELAQKAVKLDRNDFQCHANLGYIHLQRRGYDLAEHHYRQALSLNRNRPTVMACFAQLYSYQGNSAESVNCFKEAKRLDPFFEPSWYWPRLGLAYFVAGDYDEALVQFARARGMTFWGHAYLAAIYALTGRIDPAHDHAARALRQLPELTVSRFVAKEPFKNAADRQRLTDGLRKAGLPD